MRKLLKMNDPINDILPEADSVPPDMVANGNTSELRVKPKDVFPPERALLSCQMGNSVVVEFRQTRETHWKSALLGLAD
jgi:hypothetical protein